MNGRRKKVRINCDDRAAVRFKLARQSGTTLSLIGKDGGTSERILDFQSLGIGPTEQGMGVCLFSNVHNRRAYHTKHSHLHRSFEIILF